MSFSEFSPIKMARVAVVVPRSHLRSVLVEIADAGVMELDEVGRGEKAAGDEVSRLSRGVPKNIQPRLSRNEPELDQLRDRQAWDLVAGEAELTRCSKNAVDHGPARILLGWIADRDFDRLAGRLAEQGASVLRLPRPRGVEPPTRMPERKFRSWVQPLVRTYAIVPYEDVDPSLFAVVTYVLMFGMMFGDVGHGLVLAALGGLLARTDHFGFQRIRRLWFFPVAAGLSAAGFGLLYGEAFGPTGLVPTLWLSPLKEPIRLLVAAIGAGAALIGVSYAIGIINRWREGGPRLALYSSRGLAGAALFFGAALFAAGFVWPTDTARVAGGVLAVTGLLLAFAGFKANAGKGGEAVAQAIMEAFDAVIRILANVLSFGRLAAFGMTHAALGLVVWDGARSLWGSAFGALMAVLLFLVGNVLAFLLEALVAGVQALRLEYYELFSRVFSGQGRLFEPWHVAIATEKRS